MPTTLYCTRGHAWEEPLGDEPSLHDGRRVCPVCGASVRDAGADELQPVSGPGPPPDLGEAALRSGTIVVTPKAYEPSSDGSWATGGAGPEAPETVKAVPPVSPSARLSEYPDIPGYEVLGELGRGGMGVVYKARQVHLDRVVALKMILAGAHAGARDRARFRAEAQAVARLQHPNIVQIYEVGEHEGNAYFSLEFVEGGTLAGRLRGGRMSAAAAAPLVEALARAVDAAHRQGVVHRDIKPANILLAGPAPAAGGSPALGVPKLTDFGLAKLLGSDAGQTSSGTAVGTPAYMAPEQARGSGQDIGPAADVYALGVLLYEVLTGQPPFRGATLMEVFLKVTAEEPTPPSRVVPGLPRDLETVCLKCLEKDPRKRYASALDLAEDLRRFGGHEPILARPIGPWERAVRWVRRRRAATAAGAALLLAVLGLVGFGAASAYKERRRVEGRRAEIGAALVQAQAALAHGALKEADSRLAAAEATIGGEPAVADLRAEAGWLRDRVDRQLKARATYEMFVARRDEALFHAILSGDTDSAERLQATRAKALQALDLAKQLTASPLGECLGARERDEVRFGGYDLHLMLAEAVAQPLPRQTDAQRQRQAREALALLERAPRLDLQTHAYHARRARYLAQAGAEAEAAAERRLAEGRPAVTAFDHYLVGTEHYRRGDTRRAVAEFEKALGLREDHFWARYFLALSYLREKKPAFALRDLTACLAQRRAVWILVARGYVQGQLSDFAAAEADFAAARGLLRDHPDPRALYALLNNRAVTLLARNEFARKALGPAGTGGSGAVTLLARNEFAEAERDLREAVKLLPAQYQAYLSLAEARRRQDDLAGALRHLGEAISAAEALRERQELDDRTLALLYRQRARLHLQRQDAGAAAADLGRVVALKGVDDDTLLRAQRERGQVLARAGRHDDARAAYDAALALRPRDAETRRAQGELLLKLRRYAEAARSFDAYLEAGGRPTAAVYQCRARARSKEDNHPAAVADLTLALGLQPAEEGLPEEGLRLQRGQAYLACQAYSLALRDFEDVVRRQPDNGAAYLGRGLARLQLAPLGEAVADAEEAVRRAPAARHVVYGAACLLAQASGQAGRSTAPGRGGEARWRYQDRAVQLLRQALLLVPEGERTAFWRDTVRTDPSLLPIRASAAYARLERQFEPARVAVP